MKNWNTYQANKQQYDALHVAYKQKKQDYDTTKHNLELLNQFTTDAERNAILQCYNTNCQKIPEELKKEPARSAFKAYLQLQQATDTKFVVDQKKVLSYLNEFLTKSSVGTLLWQIESITFAWVEETTIPWVVRIPMTVVANFSSKQALLWFLRNIEELISPTYPMLGVVQSVTYDIVKSDSAQDVNITIDLYMLSQ